MTGDHLTLGLPLSTLYAFLLVLARVSGLVVFLPVPGFRAAPDQVRIFMTLAITFALFPVWPNLPNTLVSPGQLTAWTFAETGFGLAAGLAVGLFTDAFQLAAQIIGLQAGYGYATTIDPNSQVDAGILQIMLSLLTGLLFFGLGLDRQVIRVLAASFVRFPAGNWGVQATWTSAEAILHLGAGMFSLGLRLAMPVVALLLLIDLALALLGRMQQQLQLLSLAFPIKMLAALALLTALSPVFAQIFESSGARMIGALWVFVGK